MPCTSRAKRNMPDFIAMPADDWLNTTTPHKIGHRSPNIR
jgi:hypothetical protein